MAQSIHYCIFYFLYNLKRKKKFYMTQLQKKQNKDLFFQGSGGEYACVRFMWLYLLVFFFVFFKFQFPVLLLWEKPSCTLDSLRFKIKQHKNKRGGLIYKTVQRFKIRRKWSTLAVKLLGYTRRINHRLVWHANAHILLACRACICTLLVFMISKRSNSSKSPTLPQGNHTSRVRGHGSSFHCTRWRYLGSKNVLPAEKKVINWQ